MKMPLVFVSGLLCNELVWSHQIKGLSDISAITVVCPNHDTPQKMVDEILDQAPVQFALAGHSMGGWLALEVMRIAPERVTHLSLLNTTAKPDTPTKQAKRHELIQRVEKGHFVEVVDELVNNFVFAQSIKNDVHNMLQSAGGQTFINQEKAMLQRRECLTLLPTIHCPTLVIHAEKDGVFSLEDHLELANNIPQAKLSILEDCGHMSPMEKPAIVTSLLRSWISSSKSN